MNSVVEEVKVCRSCKCVLVVGENWSAGQAKKGNQQCKVCRCAVEYDRLHNRGLFGYLKNQARYLASNAVTRAADAGVACDQDYVNGLVFYDILVKLVGSNCPCCNTPFAFLPAEPGKHRSANTASVSVDRVIPSDGYTEANIRFICTICNNRKGSNTLDSLMQIWNWMQLGAPDILHSLVNPSRIDPPGCTP